MRFAKDAVMRNLFTSIILIFSLSGFIEAEKRVAIVASGEVHSMLYPCDCPEGPGGGWAKIAHVIEEMRGREPVLLLDAGGFSGGGIYDSYTEGRHNDSLRTVSSLYAMMSIGYDAVAVGDDDLQFGGQWLSAMADSLGIPLVCANCRYTNGKQVASPYLFIEKNGINFGITAVLTKERLFPYDTTVVVEEPSEALSAVWPELEKKSDFQIILSHLGEEQTLSLLENFPGCEVVVNGHRKTDTRPVSRVGKKIIMQFGFQGKMLSFIDLAYKKDKFEAGKSGWIDIFRDLPDDIQVKELLDKREKADKASGAAILDLYIMSQCVFGLSALKEMLPLTRDFPGIEFSVNFIGTIEPDGAMRSLHGGEEVEEEKVWLAVNSLYPDKWYDFIRLMTSDSLTAMEALEELNLSKKRVDGWVKEKGAAVLTEQYNRSMRLGINSSPTLLWNNIPVQYEISRMRIADRLCKDFKAVSRVCDSVPMCFEDSDCRSPGKVGKCVADSGKGRCLFTDATVFNFTAVVPDSALKYGENAVIATTRELFPGAKVHIVPLNSKEGASLVKKLDPPSLPLYLFDKQVENAVNFKQVEPGLKNVDRWYTLNEGVIKSRYLYKRKAAPGSLDLFIDPLFPGIEQAVSLVLSLDPELEKVNISPVFYGEPDVSGNTPEEVVRQEESHRWLVFNKYFKSYFPSYLTSFKKNPGSSYWFLILDDLGLSTKTFIEKRDSERNALKDQFSVINSLDIREPVILLINNRELIPVGNQAKLSDLLNKMLGK